MIAGHQEGDLSVDRDLLVPRGKVECLGTGNGSVARCVLLLATNGRVIFHLVRNGVTGGRLIGEGLQHGHGVARGHKGYGGHNKDHALEVELARSHDEEYAGAQAHDGDTDIRERIARTRKSALLAGVYLIAGVFFRALAGFFEDRRGTERVAVLSGLHRRLERAAHELVAVGGLELHQMAGDVRARIVGAADGDLNLPVGEILHGGGTGKRHRVNHLIVVHYVIGARQRGG